MNAIKQVFQLVLAPLRMLFSAPQKLLAAPRTLLGLSLPARLAILLAIFLLIFVGGVGIMVFRDGQWLRAHWLTNLAIVLCVTVALPLVVYWILRVWLEGEKSAYPDIQQAWDLGLAALARERLDLLDLPIFLVLGSSGEGLERPLFAASGLSFLAEHEPSGAPALRWYATSDAVFLVASRVGCLSEIATKGKDAIVEEQPLAAAGAAEPGYDPRQTARPGGPAPQPTAAPRAPAFNPRGTMMVADSGDSPAGAVPAAANPRAVRLGDQEFELHRLRLKYLCRLLRRARQPLCPINGILTLLPYGVLQQGAVQGDAVQQAVRADLETLNNSLQLRAPVTALVTGLELEVGFQEMVRRLGTQTARDSRFGKGFGVWWQSTSEQLGALSFQACSAFEQFTYDLFKRSESLSQAGNKKLYYLLCKVRRDLRPRLDKVIPGGFGHDPEQDPNRIPQLFNGCYFAATGQRPDQQAYVGSVIQKLLDTQGDLEWTAQAIAQDSRYRGLTRWMWVLNVLLIAALAGIIFVWKPS